MVEYSGGSITSTKQFVGPEERDGSGVLTKQFFKLGEIVSGAPHYFSKTAGGSISEMSDEAGVLDAEYSYDPDGVTTKNQGAGSADFQYRGKYAHAASGLYLMSRGRAYNPSLARATGAGYRGIRLRNGSGKPWLPRLKSASGGNTSVNATINEPGDGDDCPPADGGGGGGGDDGGGQAGDDGSDGSGGGVGSQPDEGNGSSDSTNPDAPSDQRKMLEGHVESDEPHNGFQPGDPDAVKTIDQIQKEFSPHMQGDAVDPWRGQTPVITIPSENGANVPYGSEAPILNSPYLSPTDLGSNSNPLPIAVPGPAYQPAFGYPTDYQPLNFNPPGQPAWLQPNGYFNSLFK